MVVDDYLPVTSANQLVFNSSKEEGEVWPCLLEKAYAKLQGSYFHLNLGFSTSAMVDFSGGFPEVTTKYYYRDIDAKCMVIGFRYFIVKESFHRISLVLKTILLLCYSTS